MGLEKLIITSNRRYFSTESGNPFFYLADTAWELFHRGSREDAELLLKDRVQKGFTVIQIVALAELDGLNTPNRYGDRPFEENDPLRPNENYWKHIDWVVNRANELGMYVGLLPTWGDKWHMYHTYDKGPEIFTQKNAREYGRWIGRRYKDAGVIWILGGDRPIVSEAHVQINRAMAEGVKEGDEGNHLMTFHPPGAFSSSKYVHCENWVDFHMQQTGHFRMSQSWLFAEFDWGIVPNRPFVNGEPSYEVHPNAFHSGDEGWLDQQDVRRELYWSICGGGAGFTYGCHPIWQMYEKEFEPVNFPLMEWKEALGMPGASQVQYGKKLALSRPYFEREPYMKLILSEPASYAPETIRACRGIDGSWAFIYLPVSQRVKVSLKELNASHVRASYFNPRTGDAFPMEVVRGGEDTYFQPPYDPEGRDWVLILDDVAKHYPLP